MKKWKDNLERLQTLDECSFLEKRKMATLAYDRAPKHWNDSVACLVEMVGSQISNYAALYGGSNWHENVAKALRLLEKPLKSDVILSNDSPLLKNECLKGAVRVFGSCFLEQDLEFMPKEYDYPKFPYFQVEPARLNTLSKAGLVLLANPSGLEEDEPDKTGSEIDMTSYTRRPMVSCEIYMNHLDEKRIGALLLNWSCKGKEGAMAKIYINGIQDVPAFEVQSTDDDPTPNFWTFLPWSEGKTVIDLKMVGSGYLWFEHVDVHSIHWSE